MTAVQPEGRFGAMEFDEHSNQVNHFMEKPKGDGAWINGGFFVCEPKIFDYIDQGDQTTWERTPLEKLAAEGELFAYRHDGFWKPMDTLRDKIQLEELLKEVDLFKKDLGNIKDQCVKIEQNNLLHIQKIGLLRFNPFKDTGGNQSFVICLLDSKNDGFIISSLFTRDGSRFYTKPIEKGASNYALSAEEKEAIKKATSS